MAVPIPSPLDFEASAAVFEAFLTAHDALEHQGRTRPGDIRPVVNRSFGLDEIAEAVARMSSNLGFGKVVLRL